MAPRTGPVEVAVWTQPTKVTGTLRRAAADKVAGTLRRAAADKVAGTLRRAVRNQAFARIPGGRHMECTRHFDFLSAVFWRR
jgi:hypothetical protein